jgi:hypothetical protein
MTSATRGEVLAPVTGVALGRMQRGPAVLRLFRRSGTRIAVLGSPAPAQLLSLRAAGGGVDVAFITPRPRFWGAVVPSGSTASFEPPGSAPSSSLVVDDSRMTDSAPLGPVTPWQCRIELRAPWTPGDVLHLTNADVVIVGAVDADIASGLRSGFGISRADAAALTALDPASIGIVHRGGIRFATLDPTPGELALLGRAH